MFRASPTFSGRVTSIDLTIVCASGEGGRGTVALDVPISPGAVAMYQLRELVPVTTGQEPQRLRVVAKGVDRNGTSFEVAPLEIALVVENHSEPDVTVLAAGDIAVCGSTSTEATARLIDRHPGAVLALGDNVYPAGTAEQYANCYAPTWGRHRDRTHPTPGNHEYQDVGGALPYFAYFGAEAGPAGLGYYSFNLGAWHILSLNSNVPAQPGQRSTNGPETICGRRQACAPSPTGIIRSSVPASNGNNSQMREIWRLLDQVRAEIVLVGHDHHYERFAPQQADGIANGEGVREFVVGTGGAELRAVVTAQPNSQIRESHTWGVLKLTLRSTTYNWDFIPIDGQSFHDFGTNACVP